MIVGSAQVSLDVPLHPVERHSGISGCRIIATRLGLDGNTTAEFDEGWLKAGDFDRDLTARSEQSGVVERRPRTSIQYKFPGISPRSMEIYRAAGIEAEIRARDLIDDRSASVARMKNLAEPEVSWQWMPPSDRSDISPTTAATCDQDQLEPILRAHAPIATRKGACCLSATVRTIASRSGVSKHPASD